MHYDLIRQFAFTLRNLDAILEKTIGHATNKGFDPNNFVTARLAPDMMPFSRQVQIACDIAKSTAAALSGPTAPRFEDHEKTIGEWPISSWCGCASGWTGAVGILHARVSTAKRFLWASSTMATAS